MVPPRQHVFVTGFARSGTTLVAKLLDAQPGFTIAVDAHWVPLRTAQEVGGFAVELPASARTRALTWHKISLEGRSLTTHLSLGDLTTAGEFHRLALDEIAAPGDVVVGHKVNGYGPPTPVFEHLLTETDVRCVCVLRDVRDVVLSQSRLGDTTLDPRRWAEAARRLRALRDHPRLAVVRYEDLVGDPARALAPVERLLGVPVVTDLRELARNGRAWRDNSSFHDVQTRLDPRPIERWREHTRDAVVRFAAWSCSDELARWGYAPFPEAFAWRERARFARAAAVRRALHAARPWAGALRRLRSP